MSCRVAHYFQQQGYKKGEVSRKTKELFFNVSWSGGRPGDGEQSRLLLLLDWWESTYLVRFPALSWVGEPDYNLTPQKTVHDIKHHLCRHDHGGSDPSTGQLQPPPAVSPPHDNSRQGSRSCLLLRTHIRWLFSINCTGFRTDCYYVDSIAVSAFADIIIELTNTVQYQTARSK